jgi:hypothetical protein
MTQEQIRERAQRCYAESLCFISLRPVSMVDETIDFVFHEEIQDVVPIHVDFA